LVHFDALKTRFREFQLRRDPACPVCSDSPSITAPVDYEIHCQSTDSQKTMTSSDSIPETTVEDLKARLDRGDSFVLLDVREPFELEIASLPSALNIPLGELPGRLGELDPQAETLILCRSGGRSANALEFLRDSGFANLWNVEGGINAWSRRIDPAVPLY
jgi:adenylyltransferase/sulfurtransferase